MISLEKLKILAPAQKLPKTVGDLEKLIVAKGFKKLPKVQSIAKSGHTDHHNTCEYEWNHVRYFHESGCTIYH